MKDCTQMTLATGLTLATIACTHFGCASVLRSPAAQATETRLGKSDSTRRRAEADGSGTSNSSHLVIHGESIAADDIWRGLDTELTEQAKSRTLEGFNEYLASRASQLIRDRIAQELLIRQATLRTPADFDRRLNGYVDAEIRKIVTSDHDGRQRRYEKWLASRGETLDEVRTRLRKDLLISSYLEQEIRPKVLEPTRAELFAEYEASLDSLRRPARRLMSLIEIRVSKRIPRNSSYPTKSQVSTAREAATTKIRELLSALENGADFAEIARQDSDGIHAPEGGAWGWVTRGSVRERFEPAVDALFKLGEGETSTIVEGGDGFFLVKCQEIDEPETPDFEALQPELADRYFKAQYNRLIMERVDKLQKQAHLAPDDLNRFYSAVLEAGIKRITK